MTERAAIWTAQNFKFLKSRLVLARGMGYNSCVSEMYILDEMCAKREGVYAIAKRHKAEMLWVFGSCVRKEVTA